MNNKLKIVAYLILILTAVSYFIRLSPSTTEITRTVIQISIVIMAAYTLLISYGFILVGNHVRDERTRKYAYILFGLTILGIMLSLFISTLDEGRIGAVAIGVFPIAFLIGIPGLIFTILLAVRLMLLNVLLGIPAIVAGIALILSIFTVIPDLLLNLVFAYFFITTASYVLSSDEGGARMPIPPTRTF